jgi:hypothetical protein
LTYNTILTESHDETIANLIFIQKQLFFPICHYTPTFTDINRKTYSDGKY